MNGPKEMLYRIGIPAALVVAGTLNTYSWIDSNTFLFHPLLGIAMLLCGSVTLLLVIINEYRGRE